VASTKRRDTIRAEDVLHVFDDACIARLAQIVKLSADADIARFAAGIREAACIYARDARVPTVAEVRDEIVALYDAARRREYERLVSLLANLSAQAHGYVEMRSQRPTLRALGLALPLKKVLLDNERRDQACEIIERLCRTGGSHVEGRNRPSGKRSKTWKPQLHAPLPLKHAPKRKNERQFVVHLRLAYVEATGKSATPTINPSRPNRPFASFVRECLKLVGAPHANAVEIINELHGRRQRS
jgi:hypothetical protein